MSEELKPCPFCGGEASLWSVIMPFDADCDTITVQCSACDAIGANVLVDQDRHDQSDLPSLEAEAIAAWNSRAALKDRDVVLEEAAERAAFVAGYRAAHMVPDAYDSTSAAEEVWEGYRFVSRNLKERV